MHEHVVLVKLQDPGVAAAVMDRMRSMRGRIAGLVELDAAQNEMEGEHSYDVMLRTRFTDRAAYEAYVTDPVHTEVAGFVRSQMVSAATFDHQVGP